MTKELGRDFEVRSSHGRVSVADSADFAPERCISRSSATRLLRMQQSPSDRVEIGECGRDFEAMQVLGKTAVAHLLEAEHPLEHPDRVLDLRPHARLGAVRGLDLFVDPTAPTLAQSGD